MKHYKWISLLFAAALTMGACSDDENNYGETGVIIEEPVATEATLKSVSVSCTFDLRDDIRYVSAGFCYSLHENPTIYDATIKSTLTNGTVSATIDGLTPYTTYHVRAYICIYQGETLYSSDIQIMPSEGLEDNELINYQAPQYLDDYRSIASWDLRDQWNLSNVHDPSVVLAEDGYYYMYQTDASYDNKHTAGGHFHARRSKDLVNWEYLGGTMQSLPEWVIPKLNEIRTDMGLKEATPNTDEFGYWAPCVRKVRDGLYRMYYSIVCPGNIDGKNSWAERAFIGMMENTDPSNNNGWVDKGYVITNASDKGLNFHVAPNDWANCYYKWNAIDPSYIIAEDGKHYLIYGSWNSGIALVELNAETGKVKAELPNPWGTNEDIAAYGQLIATREMGNRWQASEGPEIVYNLAAKRSFAVPSAAMTIHPVRTTGTVIAAPQTYSYFQRLQERIVTFVSGHSHISPEDFQALMLKKDDMAADVGSVLYGEEAVQVGLIDQVGGLADGLACLHRQIRERKPQE